MDSDAYSGTLRKPVLSLCPETCARAFEVGCGYGATLAWLKENRSYHWIGGVEISADAAREARGRLDLLVEGDVETSELPVEEASLDLLLCLDVQEHLVDPWSFLERACQMLKPGADLIVSLPNVRHHSVVLPLLLRGRFTYQEAGLLDRTHLRFFTREGMISLVERAGIEVKDVEPTCVEPGSKAYALHRASLGALEGLLAYQYIIKGTRVAKAGG